MSSLYWEVWQQQPCLGGDSGVASGRADTGRGWTGVDFQGPVQPGDSDPKRQMQSAPLIPLTSQVRNCVTRIFLLKYSQGPLAPQRRRN